MFGAAVVHLYLFRVYIAKELLFGVELTTRERERNKGFFVL